MGNCEQVKGLEPTNIILCPICQQELPDLSFKRQNEEIVVEVNCRSIKSVRTFALEELLQQIKSLPLLTSGFNCVSFEHNRKADKYCKDCEKWYCKECYNTPFCVINRHRLVNIFFSKTCHHFDKKMMDYCMNCDKNICDDCIKLHKTHDLIQLVFPDLGTVDRDMEIIDNYIKRNKEFEEQCLKNINSQLNELNSRIEQLNQSKNKLTSFFNKTREHNNLLKEFGFSIKRTATILKGEITYPLINLVSKFRSCHKLLNIDSINHFNESLTRLLSYDKTASSTIGTSLCPWMNMINENQYEDDGDLFKQRERNRKRINEKIASISFEESAKLSSPASCTKVMHGHRGKIKCMILFNNEYLVSADNTIKLWNLSTLVNVGDFKGHTKQVNCLLQVNDKILASGALDHHIKLWVVKDFTCKSTLQQHKGMVSCIINIASDVIASSSTDLTVKVWNIIHRNCIYTINNYQQGIHSLIAMNNNTLAISTIDNNIHIWSLKPFKCSFELSNHEKEITCLAKTYDNFLASGSEDASVRIWNQETGKCINILKAHKKGINSLILLEDNTLASSSSDRTIRIWNTKTFLCIRLFDQSEMNIGELKQINHEIIASVSVNVIQLWNIKESNCIASLKYNKEEEEIKCIIRISDKTFLSCSDDKIIKLWTLR